MTEKNVEMVNIKNEEEAPMTNRPLISDRDAPVDLGFQSQRGNKVAPMDAEVKGKNYSGQRSSEMSN